MKGATVWFQEAQSCRVLTLGSGSVKVGNNIGDRMCLEVASEEKERRIALSSNMHLRDERRHHCD